jgi:hypothetical protein
MSDHRFYPLRAERAADAYLANETPDLGPLCDLAERAELGQRPAMRRQAGL